MDIEISVIVSDLDSLTATHPLPSLAKGIEVVCGALSRDLVHREMEGMKECLLCVDDCESVSHVLWECPACSSLRSNFLVALHGKLGDDGFEHFQSLDSFRKASFILGSELWEDVLCLALIKVLFWMFGS